MEEINYLNLKYQYNFIKGYTTHTIIHEYIQCLKFKYCGNNSNGICYFIS